MTENNTSGDEAGRPSGGYGAETGVGMPTTDDAGNPDWNRDVPDREAQRTAREADPDDLGSTAAGSGLMAGGDATDVEQSDDSNGGTPLTEGYVTGGAHRARLADVEQG
jgi:hypothetical protein